MSGGLGIFVKTPALSPVKTRLAQDVGSLRAEAFYLAAAEAVASVALDAQDQGGPRAYWAVAEASAMTGNAWLDLPRLSQGQGSLGQRMDSVYRQLCTRHRFALLVGADTPQISASSLLRATHWLAADEHRLVIGRAADGGFWLFGGNVALPSPAWSRPAYSSASTANEFIAAMSPYGAWLELESRTDVDHGRDLLSMQRELGSLPTPTAAQVRLAQWLEDALSGTATCR